MELGGRGLQDALQWAAKASILVAGGDETEARLIYFGFGTQQIVERDSERIEQKLDPYLDGHIVELPELQSIIFLNIDSWRTGYKLCELSNSVAKN